MTTAPPGFRYIDIHTHLHPDWLARAIRRWFAERSNWKLEYPSDPEWVAAFLEERGVERFVFFSYAHKLGIAREINAWLHATARRLPAGIALGTLHPDDSDMLETAERALDEYGFPGFKFHINVQRFYPDDPRVLPVYERLLARGRFLLIQRIRRLPPLRPSHGAIPGPQGGGGAHGVMGDAGLPGSHGALSESLSRHHHGLRPLPARASGPVAAQ